MNATRDGQEPFDPKRYLAKMKEEQPDSYWWHIDAAYRKVDIYNGGDAFQDSCAPFPAYIRDLVAAHWFLSEVANGGVMQFFMNPTGVLAPESIRAFSNLGLSEVAAVIETCMARFGEPYPRERDDRIMRILELVGLDDPQDALSAPLYLEEENALYRLGGQKFDRIYDRMDAYAKEKNG